MRFQLGAAMLLTAIQPGFAQTPAPAASCEQQAFAAVVAEASATLAAMNDNNRTVFQAKLAALNAREGWSGSDYASKATPFVKDAAITALDDANKMLLNRVPQIGGDANLDARNPADGRDLAARRCVMLDELRALMGQVIANTKAKWAHMLGNVDTALDASRQAEAGGQ